MEKLSKYLDAVVLKTGRIAMWSNALLVAVIILQVVLRYVFNNGMVALEELEWHLYAAGLMTGASYAMVKDAHIRVDLIYSKLSFRTRAFWQLFGTLVLLLPFLFIIFHQSLDFVYESWRVGESSTSPMGLPFRWIVKSLIPFGFILMMAAALSGTIKLFIELKRGKVHGD